jgi:hypothetical protein
MKGFIFSLLIFAVQVITNNGPDKMATKSDGIQICNTGDFSVKGSRLGNNYYIVDKKEINKSIHNFIINTEIITCGVHITYGDKNDSDSISNNKNAIKYAYFTSNDTFEKLDTFDLLHVIKKNAYSNYGCCCCCCRSCSSYYIIDGYPVTEFNRELLRYDDPTFSTISNNVPAEYENLGNQMKEVIKPNSYPNHGNHTELVFSGY